MEITAQKMESLNPTSLSAFEVGVIVGAGITLVGYLASKVS